MGHHISKQQNRQMSDEHQRMNRTKIHLEPTSSANRVKSNCLAQKLKTKKHSKQPNDAKIGIGNIVKTAKRSANNSKKGQECSAGSVVITIRLLKMESNIKDIETITNMNALQSGSTVHLATDKSETINNNEDDMNSAVALSTSNISNDNDKHLNNNNSNLCENVDKKTVQSITFDSLSENNDILSMFNQTNEMNNKNSLSSVQCNRINSLSENLNCDTISANISSLFDRTELLMPSDSELGLNIVAEKIFNIESTPTPTPTSTSQQTAVLAEPTISQKILRDFFPSGLISTVSPYPHHIPIANIVKSECTNSDNSQHPAQSHHSKAHGNCCNKQTPTTHKDAKDTKTKKPNWSIKFNCTKLKGSGSSPNTPNEASESNSNTNTTNSNCANSSKEPTSQAAALVLDKSTVFSTNGGNVFVVTMDQRQLDLARLTPDEYAIDEDCDKKARIQRAIEIAEGVEPPPGFISTNSLKSLHSMAAPNSQLVPNSMNSTNDTNSNNAGSKINAQQWHMLCSNPQTLRLLNDFHNLLQTTDEIPRIHSQVDYIHCLVPDLKQITNCSYYWGKMDRYEAERLLENKPEGTFLLRDSAQEEFLFSVSFRKYGRSLHARIEQFNHKFSFDVHDPGVYTANTVTGLLEHYKDPACVMFFEPALTLPLNRKYVYSLQQLCRATIVSHTTYDGINEICLPRKLKSYLKEYHYRQRVKVRRFDESNYGAT